MEEIINMPEGILNKTTILIFSNEASLKAYNPPGNNRIGIDNVTGNYWIYNDFVWRMFRENIPSSTTPDWYPTPFPDIGNAWVNSGYASQSFNNKEPMVQNVTCKAGDYLSLHQSQFVVQTATVNAGSNINVLYETTRFAVSTSLIGP
jgi:hypothetical protein